MAGAAPRNTSGTLASQLDGALHEGACSARFSCRSDAFLYSGNRHETVPRALFHDRRLTPLERNAWQVFRLQLNDNGVTAVPSYDELRVYLASMPCDALASHETVARALTLLRLTRWLSLVHRRRDEATGRILGNLYVLHDEPLTPFEAMQLDPDYLGLVSRALSHAAKAVQLVGTEVLREVLQDPLLRGRTLPSRLQALAQRLDCSDATDALQLPEAVRGSMKANDSDGSHAADPSSDSEVGMERLSERTLRIPKTDSTVRTNDTDSEVRTVPGANRSGDLRLPERFAGLRQEQQTAALMALQRVDSALRQAVLDEWAARCRGNVVRNPAGYLFGIIQKALRGEFKPWSAEDASAFQAQPSPISPTTSPGSSRRRIDPETARIHMEAIRAFLRTP